MTKIRTRLLGGASLALLLASALLTAVTAPAHAAGWQRVLEWSGGVTYACVAPGSTDDTRRVRVYWNGSGYDWASNGSGGLGRVSGQWQISDWTYSVGDAGGNGPVVSLEMGKGRYVYLLVGSNVGITREVVVPVAFLSECAGGRAVGPVERAGAQAATERAGACMSKKEFRKLERGMTPRAVKRIVDGKGRQISEAKLSLNKRYRKCGGGRAAVVNFSRAKASKPLRVTRRFW